MPRVLLNIQHYDHAWTVYFVEADCRTRVGTRTRFINFPTLDVHRRFLTRCQPEDTTLTGFEQRVRAWDQGQRVRRADGPPRVQAFFFNIAAQRFF
jgi:hypothetical protein